MFLSRIETLSHRTFSFVANSKTVIKAETDQPCSYRVAAVFVVFGDAKTGERRREDAITEWLPISFDSAAQECKDAVRRRFALAINGIE